MSDERKVELSDTQQLIIRQCKSKTPQLKILRKIIHKYWNFGKNLTTTDEVLLNQLIKINDTYNPNRIHEFDKIMDCGVEKYQECVEGLDTSLKRNWLGDVNYPDNIVHLMINWYSQEIRYINICNFPNYRTPTWFK